MYQFGVWSENDGASGLLDADELAKASVWSSVIGVGASYDLIGAGKTATGLITAAGQGVQQGYMPKLMDADSGYLLYDQPNVTIGQTSVSHLGNVATSPGTGTEEAFFATVTLYNDREDLLTASNLAGLIDVNGITVIGGEADIPDDWNQGVYTADGKTGRRIKLKIRYGASGGPDGQGQTA